MYNIGYHVYKGDFGDISDSIRYSAEKANMKCAQIFTHNPQKKCALSKNIDLKLLKFTCKELNINLYIHAPYVTIKWSDEPSKEESLNILDMLLVGKDCGAKGVVFHLPGKTTISKVISRLAKLNKIIGKYKEKNDVPDLKLPKFILEHIASRCSCKLQNPNESQNDIVESDDDDSEFKILAENVPEKSQFIHPEDINLLSSAILEEKFANLDVGFCLDTAHIYVSSSYDLSYESSNLYVKLLEPTITRGMISLIHLNGSQSIHKSGDDKHAVPTSSEDNIWGSSENMHGINPFINLKIDMIIEAKVVVYSMIKRAISHVNSVKN
jgi:endonuclease IV